MKPRLTHVPATTPLALALVLALAASSACTRRQDACGDASTTAAELATPAATRTAPAPPPPVSGVPPLEPASAPPVERPRALADAGSATDGAAAAATPSWVPDSGRVTIVEARDLARNLGIVTATAAAIDASAASPESDASR